MTTLATRKFWLDGGYDRELVDACKYSPQHKWWEFRLGDVLVPEALAGNGDERMVICRGCYVPRCGHTTDEDPCMLHRHHDGDHLPLSEALNIK